MTGPAELEDDRAGDLPDDLPDDRTGDGTLPGPVADQPYPTRRELVREAAPSRSARGLRSTLTDTYTTVLEVGIATLLLLGGSASLRGALQSGLDSTGDGPGFVPSTSAVLSSAGLAVCLVLLGLAALCRLGPVSLGTAPTTWWTPLPVPRAALLRPVLRQRAVVAAVAGGAVVGWAASVAFGVTDELTTATLLPGLAGGAGLGAGLALAGYVLVSRPAIRGKVAVLLRLGTVLDVTALLLLVALTASAFARVPLDALHPRTLVLPAVVAGAAALAVLLTLGVRSWRDVASTPSPSLRRGAARLERLTSSLLQIDVREFGRALAADSPRRVRSRRRVGARAAWVSGADTAVWAADLFLLRRQPRRPVLAGALVLLPFVVAAGTSAHRAVAALLLWVAGYAAATTLSEAARSMVLTPAAARTLPLGTTRLVALRLLPVGAAMALWGAVAVPLAATTSGLVHGETSGTAWWAWALLGAVAGPGWAAAALRGAVRPDPDFSGPAISTAMGGLPPGAAAATTTGPDLGLLVVVPVLLAMLARGAFPLLVGGQVLATAAAVAIAWAYAAHRMKKVS